MNKNKGKRFITIMLIPHTDESTYSVRIPLLFFQVICVVLLVSLLGGLLCYNSYRMLQEEAAEINLLRNENRYLNERFNILAAETEELKNKLEGIDKLSLSIRSLMELPESQERDNASDFIAQNQVRVLASRNARGVIDRTVSNISFLDESISDSNNDLLQLKKDIEDYQLQQAATPSIWPARGRVTSEFGTRVSPISRRREFHYGIDVAGFRGTPIFATAAGKVTTASYRRGYGNTVQIDHGYNLKTVYAHLNRFNVSPGDEVYKGQVIGFMGSTGYTTGTHLHYEVHYNGKAVNPRAYIP